MRKRISLARIVTYREGSGILLSLHRGSTACNHAGRSYLDSFSYRNIGTITNINFELKQMVKRLATAHTAPAHTAPAHTASAGFTNQSGNIVKKYPSTFGGDLTPV